MALTRRVRVRHRRRRLMWVPVYVPRRALRLVAAGTYLGVQPPSGTAPEAGAPEHLPEYPVDEEELYPPVAEHLPEYEYDHEVDGGAEEELPPHEPSPPVKPGKPGDPVPRPCIPVVRAVELEPGEEVPAAQPSQPGCLCIVYVDQASPKALAWLQGESDLPMAMHETEAHPPTTPTPQPGTPVQPHPEREFHGHWVRVETTPSEPDHDGHHDEATLGWAYVFEINERF